MLRLYIIAAQILWVILSFLMLMNDSEEKNRRVVIMILVIYSIPTLIYAMGGF